MGHPKAEQQVVASFKAVLTSFKGKLLIATATLLGLVVVLAGLFFVTTERYHAHLERSEHASRLLSGLQAISDHTYRKLNALEIIVATRNVRDAQARAENEKLLWSALANAARDASVNHAIGATEGVAPARIEAIETLVERIIDGGARIRNAIQAGEIAAAQAELATLRSDEVSGTFNNLIDEALTLERAVVAETRTAADALEQTVTDALPLGVLLIVGFGLTVAALLSRTVLRSLDALLSAADAYRSDELEHRLPALAGAEFNELGQAFNRMADELSARRTEARLANERLEQEVLERTRALESTLSELEAAGRGRTQLLADISHELRTPLTIIRGEADMALRGAEKEAEVYVDALQRVRAEAVHTTRLVKDLLFVARAEEGKAKLEERFVPLNDLVGEVALSFRSAAADKTIDVVEELPVEAISVRGDPGRLRQVVAVLLDNAIRYSSEGSDIGLMIRPDDAAHVELRVTNTGARLSEEDAKLAFSRFYRGDNAASVAEGSGLGLPVAKAIVEAHGGEISLRNEGADRVAAVVRLPVEGNAGAGATP